MEISATRIVGGFMDWMAKHNFVPFVQIQRFVQDVDGERVSVRHQLLEIRNELVPDGQFMSMLVAPGPDRTKLIRRVWEIEQTLDAIRAQLGALERDKANKPVHR